MSHPTSPDWLGRLPEIVNLLPVAVEVYDRDFRLVFCNSVSDELFLYETPVIHHDDWWDVGFPDPVSRASAHAEWNQKVLRARQFPDEVQSSEWSVLCRDGLMRIVQFRYRFIDDNYIVVFWDVTDQRRQEEELRRLAGSDPLTGLLNRRHFFEFGEAAFHKATLNQLPLSVLVLDVDGFKSFNDSFGHKTGDDVLQAVATRCSSSLAGRGIIGRIGGDEFAVLLTSLEPGAAEKMADRLCDSIGRAPIRTGSRNISAFVSIGGASRRPIDESLDGLMERADRALYAAKANGRNRVVFDAA